MGTWTKETSPKNSSNTKVDTNANNNESFMHGHHFRTSRRSWFESSERPLSIVSFEAGNRLSLYSVEREWSQLTDKRACQSMSCRPCWSTWRVAGREDIDTDGSAGASPEPVQNSRIEMTRQSQFNTSCIDNQFRSNHLICVRRWVGVGVVVVVEESRYFSISKNVVSYCFWRLTEYDRAKIGF